MNGSCFFKKLNNKSTKLVDFKIESQFDLSKVEFTTSLATREAAAILAPIATHEKTHSPTVGQC